MHSWVEQNSSVCELCPWKMWQIFSDNIKTLLDSCFELPVAQMLTIGCLISSSCEQGPCYSSQVVSVCSKSATFDWPGKGPCHKATSSWCLGCQRQAMKWVSQEDYTTPLRWHWQHVHWDLNTWRYIMFSEESRFCLQLLDCRIKALRGRGQHCADWWTFWWR